MEGAIPGAGLEDTQLGGDFAKEGARNRGGGVAGDIHASHGQGIGAGAGTSAMDQLDTVPAPAVSAAEPLRTEPVKLLARE